MTKTQLKSLDGEPLIKQPAVNKQTATAALMKLELIEPAEEHCIEYRILLRVCSIEEMTEGGIFKPESFFEKEMFEKTRATLVCKGPEAFTDSNGAPIMLQPQIGDVVRTTKYAGNVYRDADNNLYRFANDKDVVAIVRGA